MLSSTKCCRPYSSVDLTLISVFLHCLHGILSYAFSSLTLNKQNEKKKHSFEFICAIKIMID